MRVAMLSPIEWKTSTGSWERVISTLMEGLLKKGVDVTLFDKNNAKSVHKLPETFSCECEEEKGNFTKIFQSLNISELYERADDFDIIHNLSDFLPLSYSRLVTTPVLTTIDEFASKSVLIFEKYNDSTFYVSTSNAARSSTLDYVSTVYNGIDVGKFTFEPEHGKYLLLLMAGQNIKYSIEIAEKAQKNLVIAGAVSDECFKKYVEPHINTGNVSYLGDVAHEKMGELLGGAYALIQHKFGLSVIEAMACGTPVVAFNVAGMSEIVTQGKNGFLVSNVDEAVSAVAKIDEIDRRKCRRSVEERFSAEKMVDSYISAYEHVMEKRKREDHRPWGYYTVLSDEPNHKVKRIVVYPGKRLSLQRHQRRAEHWYVVYGSGVITLDGSEIPVSSGDAVDIARGAVHRVENRGSENMAFIEVQVGDYFGEDDIERLEDDYGRL